MIRGLKLAHLGGLVVFLGSIVTFIVISALIDGASLEKLAFGRQIISAGTKVLTVPGMWVLAVTGICMGYTRYGVRSRFFQIKLVIITLVVLNAHFFVVPAVNEATMLAIRSLAEGQLLPSFKVAYMREEFFGATNLLLTVAAAVIAIWRIGVKPIGNV